MRTNIQMWPLEVFSEVFVPTATTTPLSKFGRCSVVTRGRTGAGTTDRGPGPDYVACVLGLFSLCSFCRFYKLTTSDPAQGTLQLIVFPIQCLPKDLQLVRSCLLGRGGVFFFLPGPEPAVGGTAGTDVSGERAAVIPSKVYEAATCHISEESTFKYPRWLFFVKSFPFSAYR